MGRKSVYRVRKLEQFIRSASCIADMATIDAYTHEMRRQLRKDPTGFPHFNGSETQHIGIVPADFLGPQGLIAVTFTPLPERLIVTIDDIFADRDYIVASVLSDLGDDITITVTNGSDWRMNQ